MYIKDVLVRYKSFFFVFEFVILIILIVIDLNNHSKTKIHFYYLIVFDIFVLIPLTWLLGNLEFYRICIEQFHATFRAIFIAGGIFVFTPTTVDAFLASLLFINTDPIIPSLDNYMDPICYLGGITLIFGAFIGEIIYRNQLK